jgi:RHS repeat-associated protein
VHARQSYYLYGEVRYVTGELPAEFDFTGQHNESTIGLYDYHARRYDPSLRRYISADTIVPDFANP